MEQTYSVRLRETGKRRHRGLGRDRLTDSWIHTLIFDEEPKAREAIAWLFERNPGAFDSAQLVDPTPGASIATVAP